MWWPNSEFIKKECPVSIGRMRFNVKSFRLTWRTMFVLVVTILAMAMPFFNEMFFC